MDKAAVLMYDNEFGWKSERELRFAQSLLETAHEALTTIREDGTPYLHVTVEKCSHATLWLEKAIAPLILFYETDGCSKIRAASAFWKAELARQAEMLKNKAEDEEYIRKYLR